MAEPKSVTLVTIRRTMGRTQHVESGTDIGRPAAAGPIHETGHAVAVKLLTGIWPRFTLWAVFPPAIQSSEAAMAILLAGDLAVVLWWLFVMICVRHRPEWRWALIGPSFMAVISLASWFVAAAMTPFGMAAVGASDAAKFLDVSGMSPLWVISGVSLAAFGMGFCARNTIAAKNAVR